MMSLFAQIQRNKRLSLLVIIGFVAFLLSVGAGIGYVFWDDWLVGAIMALIISLIYIPITLLSSTRMIMAMNRAIEIKSEEEHPFLWHTVESLAIAARVPRPRIFIIETDAPNAFAAGLTPKNAAVAVTRGLLKRLNREEIEAVLAHEMAHIRNYDVRLATIAIAMVGVIALMSEFAFRYAWWGGTNRRKSDSNNRSNEGILVIIALLLILLSPTIATLIQLLLSRRREFLADAEGARLCRTPLALASALEKISQSGLYIENVPEVSASLYFSDPRKKKQRGSRLSTWLSTHPPTEERIKALRQMVSEM